MNTVSKSQILPFISTNGTNRRDGTTANVYPYQDRDKKFAYKEYKYQEIESDRLAEMEKHISAVFDKLSSEDINIMRSWGSLPLYLVYEDKNDTFCGFIMDRLPDDCYESFDSGLYASGLQECNLDSFFCYAQEYEDIKLRDFTIYLQRIIQFWHSSGILMGDSLSAANTCIRKTSEKLYPFFIDTDSFMPGTTHPLGTYDSNNYIPPQEDIKHRSNKTDVYKFCLIVLRLFSMPEMPAARADLMYISTDEDVKKSLFRIEKVFGKEYKSALIKGLSDSPSERPDITEFINCYNNVDNKEKVNKGTTYEQGLPNHVGRKPGLNDLCPCGSGLKYKNCHGKPGGNTPVKLPNNGSTTSANTNKPKQTPSGSSSSKTTNRGTTTSSNANKPKQSTADVQRVDKESLKRVKRVGVSLYFILLTLAILVTILALSKCEVPPAPWDLISRLIPLVPWTAYMFTIDMAFDGKCGTRKITAALWIVLNTVLFLTLCYCTLALRGMENVVFLKLSVFALSIWSLPVFALVAIGSIKILSAKDNSGQHLSLLRILSIILCSVLAMLLVIGTVKQVKEFNSLKVGDAVLFGCYEQDGDTSNGQEEISWTVMSVDDGKALLLSDVCLYAMPYNSDRTDNSWTNSDLRKWLNGEFYQSSFSSTEQGVIIEKEITTERRNDKEGDTYFEPYGEAEVTIDKVFAPDYYEYWELTSDLNVSAVAKEIFTSHNKSFGSENYRSMFWTRSPFGEERNYASGYNAERERSCGYVFWPNEYAMVRPAIYVDIDLYSDLPREKQDQTAPASYRNNNTVGGGWGDSLGGRPTYTIEQINKGILGDNIVLNSIVDTNDSLSPEDKAAGVIIPLTDERNFVGARENSGNYGKDNLWNGNVIEAEEGKTYVVRLYVHNNNPQGYDAIAENVSVQFQITDLRHVLQNDISLEGFDSSNGYYGVGVNGYIDTSNANPSSYWDGVKFVSDKPFELRYIPGTALLENNGIGATNGSGYKLNDDIVTDKKVLLGYDSLDGNIPGCYGYAAYVTIEVEPVFLAAKLQIVARLKGTAEWVEAVDAQIGDEVEYQIEYKNLLSSTVEDVMIRDVLPDNIEYIEGSTILFNSNHPEGVSIKNDTVTTTGINIGSYEANGNAYVRFLGRVIDKSLAHGSNQLVNWASVTIYIDNEAYVYKDDVSAMVDKRQ